MYVHFYVILILKHLLIFVGTRKRSFGRCRTCKNRNMTTDSDKWCKDCQELFCNTCSMVHGATNYSANHNILCLNESMEHFPPKISQTLICNEHDRDFLFFCETHQHISCIECVRSYHSSNCDIVALTFAALNRISSSALEKSIELNVQELIADIEQVLSDLAKLSSSIKLQYSQIKTSIAEECKGNETMDTTLKDLKSKYETCTYVIEKDVNTLKSIKLNISAVDIQLYQSKRYCSERQAFVFMHNAIKSVSKADETFRSYINTMKTVNLHCESGEQLHMQGYQKEIIDIVCQFKPYNFHSARKYENNKQAQAQISEMKKKNIDTIRLSKEFVFNIEFNRQRNFEFNFACLNDKLFINNTAGGLTVYNIDGKFHKEIDLPVRPEFEYPRIVCDRVDDITVINKDLLAVMRRKDILCVNVNDKVNQQITKICDRNSSYLRLSCYEEFLYFLNERLSITVKDLAGDVVRTIDIKHNFYEDILSFVVDKNKIFILSGHFYLALTCFNLHGRLFWSAKIPENICRRPSTIQITVDKWGNCYVPSSDSNITVISNDGQQSKLLLPDSDIIENPTGVVFEKTNNRLVVFDYDRICTVFHVT